MAGSRPGESNGGATGSIHPLLPDYAVSLVRDYDLKGVAAMLYEVADCSYEVQMEAVSKAMETCKWPNAIGAFPNEGKAKDEEEDREEDDLEEEEDDVEEEDDDDVDEEEEDGEVEDEEILELQVPNEGERECKKPRLAEGFGCQAEAAV